MNRESAYYGIKEKAMDIENAMRHISPYSIQSSLPRNEKENGEIRIPLFSLLYSKTKHYTAPHCPQINSYKGKLIKYNVPSDLTKQQ